MHIGWPQCILVALMSASIGICMARYGEQKTDRYDITDVLIGPAITLGLLLWGGFFG